MNSSQSFSQLLFMSCCLMWSLSKAQDAPEALTIQMGSSAPTNPYNNNNFYTPQAQSQQSQQTVELKSPLLRTLVSRLEPAESNPGIPQDPLVMNTNFFSSFVQHLETRRSQNQSSFYAPNRLELTIRDGSSTAVNIEFSPSGFGNAHFNAIVDLLADSLAFVIQEAERQGFQPNFKYLVSLDDIRPQVAYGPGLSANALKSAAG